MSTLARITLGRLVPPGAGGGQTIVGTGLALSATIGVDLCAELEVETLRGSVGGVALSATLTRADLTGDITSSLSGEVT